ncbi:MAG: hypothetical protein AB7I01_01885 [Gammaproteobacteria bacterium]
MKPRTKTADAPTLVHVTDDPVLAPLNQRLAELREQHAAACRRVAALEPRRPGDDHADRRDKVAAVIAREPVQQVARRGDERSALDAALEEREILREAISQLELATAAALEAAQRRMHLAMLPEFQAVAAQMAAALAIFGEAQEASLAFADKVRAAGAGDWPRRFGPLGVARVGVPTNDHSVFAGWLAAAMTAGAIDADQVPQRWLAEWGTLRDVDDAADPSRARLARAKVQGNGEIASAPTTRARAGARRDGW